MACDLCRKRPAAPPRGLVGPTRRGEKVTVRVPKLVGHTVVGWRVKTIGIADETAEVSQTAVDTPHE